MKLNKAGLPQIYNVLVSSTSDSPTTSKNEIKLTISKVRQAMLILLQHNCLFVDPYEVSSTEPIAIGQNKKPMMPGSTYSLDTEMIINRLRFPLVLQNINKSYGFLATLIAEEILFHGKLRMSDILTEVMNNVNAIVHSVANNKLKSNHANKFLSKDATKTSISSLATDDDLKHLCDLQESNTLKTVLVEKFIALREGNWILKSTIQNSISLVTSELGTEGVHRRGGDSWFLHKNLEAPAPGRLYNRSRGLKDIFSPTTATNTKKIPLSIKSKKSDIVVVNDDMTVQLTGSNAVITSNTVNASNKRTMVGMNIDVNESIVTTNKRARATPTATPATTATSTTPAAVMASDIDFDTVWAINFNTLFLIERKDLCIQSALERVGKIGSEIISALFSPSNMFSTDAFLMTIDSVDSTIKMTVAQITSEVNYCRQKATTTTTNAAASTLSIVDRNTIRATVEVLCTDNAKFLIKDPLSTTEQYSVNIRGIIDFLRQQSLYKIISDRHQPYSNRIVQLLLAKRYLEQQAISDMIIAPPRDTRLHIYELFKNGWIDVHEVCKKTDYSPSSTQYYWFTTQAQLMTTLLDNLYTSAFNVKLRRQIEYGKVENSLEFSVIESEDLRLKFECYQKVLSRLDSAVFKIDKTLQLCSRF